MKAETVVNIAASLIAVAVLSFLGGAWWQRDRDTEAMEGLRLSFEAERDQDREIVRTIQKALCANPFAAPTVRQVQHALDTRGYASERICG